MFCFSFSFFTIHLSSNIFRYSFSSFGTYLLTIFAIHFHFHFLSFFRLSSGFLFFPSNFLFTFWMSIQLSKCQNKDNESLFSLSFLSFLFLFLFFFISNADVVDLRPRPLTATDAQRRCFWFTDETGG